MYKERFGKIILTMLPIFLISLILSLITLPQVIEFFTNFLSKASGIVTVLIIALAILVLFAVAALTLVSVNALIVQFSESGSLPVKEAFRRVWPLTLSTLWVSLIAGFAIYGGLILFLIPGILISVWLMFTVFVLVLEGKKGMSALLASKHYAQGYFWKIFWRLIVVFFFVILISIVMGLVMMIVSVPLLYLNSTLAIVITTLINTIFSTFLIQPLVLIYEVLMYYNLKAIKGPGQAVKGRKLFIGLGIFAVLFALMMSISFTALFLKTQRLGLPLNGYNSLNNNNFVLPADFNLDDFNLPQ